jgi:DNA-binding PadR family transcriptional regulator
LNSTALNATAASLLGFLHEGPMTGWELVATAERVIGDFWSLTRSQVYRELASMAEAGLVEAGERESRDRQPYTITDAGRAAFAEWILLLPGPETIRFPLLLTTVFGRHLPPGRLPAIVEEHRTRHADRLAKYVKSYDAAAAASIVGEPGPYAMAVLEFGLAYERAVLSWFDNLPPAIRG